MYWVLGYCGWVLGTGVLRLGTGYWVMGTGVLGLGPGVLGLGYCGWVLGTDTGAGYWILGSGILGNGYWTLHGYWAYNQSTYSNISALPVHVMYRKDQKCRLYIWSLLTGGKE